MLGVRFEEGGEVVGTPPLWWVEHTAAGDVTVFSLLPSGLRLAASVVDGDTLWASMEMSLRTVDLATPTAPRLRPEGLDLTRALGVGPYDVRDGWVALGVLEEVTLVDGRQPERPRVAGALEQGGLIMGVAWQPPYVWALVNTSGSLSSLALVDATLPAFPDGLGQRPLSADARRIGVSGDLAWALDEGAAQAYRAEERPPTATPVPVTATASATTTPEPTATRSPQSPEEGRAACWLPWVGVVRP